MRKIFTSLLIFFLSNNTFSEVLSNQDVDIASGSTRPVIAIGYDHQVSDNQILRIKGQYQELPYQGMNETNLYASYNFLF